MPQYYINREWVETDQPMIPLNEAGFLRGDGIFETVSVTHGEVFRLNDHLNRLFTGLELIRITSEESRKEISALVREYIRRNHLSEGIIRIIVTRGIYETMPWNHSGPNSLYLTHMTASPAPDEPARIVFLKEEAYPVIRKHPAIKSLNYLGNILAKIDAHAHGAFEPVFYNEEGWITEGGIRNIFFVKAGTLITPPLTLGILQGTMRNTVVEVAQLHGVPVEESLIKYTDVNSVDEAFLTSTSIRILPVYWNEWSSDYRVTSQLKTDLNMFIEKEIQRY